MRLRARLDSCAREGGFTLIELLVVMLILGALASIAMPAFFNQKGKAGDAKAKEYLHSAQVAMETCYTNKNGTYVGCNAATLKVVDPSLKSAPGLTISALAVARYKIQIDGAGTTQKFWIESNAGVLKFECNVDGTAGCPSTGKWGT